MIIVRACPLAILTAKVKVKQLFMLLKLANIKIVCLSSC